MRLNNNASLTNLFVGEETQINYFKISKAAGCMNSKELLEKVFNRATKEANYGKSVTLNLKVGHLILCKGSFEFKPSG